MKNLILLLILFTNGTIVVFAQSASSTSHTANSNNMQGAFGTFIGVSAGSANVFDENTYIGYRAGENIVSSQWDNKSNVAIGVRAGLSSTGLFSDNILIGSDAGTQMNMSWANVMIGTKSGFYSEGTGNLFFGPNTGTSSNGNSNLFFGKASGQSNSGDNNVFIGKSTGSGNNGDYNLFVGFNSGRNHTGGNNIYIGRDIGFGETGNNNIIIGNNAGDNMSGLQSTLIIENSDSDTPLVFGSFASNKIGINTTNLVNAIGGQNISNYSLYVDGGMLSDEVRVRTDWADYVFDDSYQLKSISELDAFILENGHLPNCPSAEQVLEQGIEIGNITKIQQEKIEELTLYIIQQNNDFNELRNEFDELKQLLLKQGN